MENHYRKAPYVGPLNLTQRSLQYLETCIIRKHVKLAENVKYDYEKIVGLLC